MLLMLRKIGLVDHSFEWIWQVTKPKRQSQLFDAWFHHLHPIPDFTFAGCAAPAAPFTVGLIAKAAVTEDMKHGLQPYLRSLVAHPYQD